MQWILEHGFDVVQAASLIIAGVSIIVSFTVTKKDDTVVKYIRDVLAKILSLK